jgi:hypothetical protein
MTMFRIGFVSAVASGCFLAGCGYLGPASHPPAPGRPHLAYLTPPHVPSCDVQLSVAGLRLVTSGIYIDVLIQTREGHDPCEVGQWLAWQVYYMGGDDHEPGDAFVVQDREATPLPLLRPRMRAVDYGHSGLPGYVPPVVPGCWMLGEGAAVQTFVFETRTEAEPGGYSVKVTPWLEDLLRSRTSPKGAAPPIPVDANICVSTEPAQVSLAPQP